LKLLLFACIAASTVITAAEAQTERRKPGVGNEAVVKGIKVAPAKSQVKTPTNTTPRPTTLAPLTAAECEGLGGKVVQSVYCIGPSSKGACQTVDQNGVVRTKCINR
jgi:hypothetical protein